jgi:hypothetical protein
MSLSNSHPPSRKIYNFDDLFLNIYILVEHLRNTFLFILFFFNHCEFAQLYDVKRERYVS